MSASIETNASKYSSGLFPIKTENGSSGFPDAHLFRDVAVMGLAANSVAVVIGAMLIAPHDTDHEFFGWSVSGSVDAIQAAVVVGIGSLWSLVYSIVLSRLLPSLELGSEILRRTSPDIRDLVVAIAAGAAGHMQSLTKTLCDPPGVAVAVALVPPPQQEFSLLPVKVCLLEVSPAVCNEPVRHCVQRSRNPSHHRRHSDRPLLLQRFSNGRRRHRHLYRNGCHHHSTHIAFAQRWASSRQQSDILAEVVWLGNKDLEVTTLDVIGTAVTVELTGLDEPPEAYALATRLVPALGADAEVAGAGMLGLSSSAGTPPAADPQKWQQPCSTTGSSVSPMKASCWNCSRSPSQKGRSS